MHPLLGLAAVSLFLADVPGGLGPFLAAWLAEAAKWDPARIGLVMTLSGLAGLACNTPAGTALGAVGTMKGIGASLSTTLGGVLATSIGWGAALSSA